MLLQIGRGGCGMVFGLHGREPRAGVLLRLQMRFGAGNSSLRRLEFG